MRMKRTFRIGLLLMLFIAALAVVLPRGAPNFQFQDAGIQCVSPMDQSPVFIQDMPVVSAIVFGCNYGIALSSVALRQGDVEESPISYFKTEGLSNGIMTMGENYINEWSLNQYHADHYDSPGENNRIERQYRLDIGERLSPARGKC